MGQHVIWTDTSSSETTIGRARKPKDLEPLPRTQVKCGCSYVLPDSRSCVCLLAASRGHWVCSEPLSQMYLACHPQRAPSQPSSGHNVHSSSGLWSPYRIEGKVGAIPVVSKEPNPRLMVNSLLNPMTIFLLVHCAEYRPLLTFLSKYQRQK